MRPAERIIGRLEMVEEKGRIFNIQKFSITDGIGIRTLIFMKGCPLRCIWCSNPESQNPYTEIMDVRKNCISCGMCVSVCEENAIEDKTFNIIRDRCTACGKCAEVCYANAKKVTGKEYSVYDVIKIIDRDRVFYKNSGGGVTIGGGEPLMQPEFAAEILKCCRMTNIHTAIETSGFAPLDKACLVFEQTDQIFFDLKVMDDARHKELTGISNSIILRNAEEASAFSGKEIIFRIPVIPGLNDDRNNLRDTGLFIREISQRSDSSISVELLPYHGYGSDKYKWMNRSYSLEGMASPSAESMEIYKNILIDTGVNVV